MHHKAFDVFKCAAHFFPRIEDVERVKYFFHLGEKHQHFWAKHEREVWRADDAIVVFAGYGTLVFCDQFIHPRREL